MAKATLPVKQGVILELTYEEAQAVFAVVGKVSGPTKTSPREYTSNVYYALSNLLNTATGDSDYQGLLFGNLTFNDF